MSSIPRRLRKINFSEQDAENVEPNEGGLQGPPEIDNILPGIPHESTSPIKIIWPNGDMRQIVGVFRSQFLSKLNGGKIIVGTDQNGVPNERSGSILSSYLTKLAQNSTIAPLHIPRWDNEMFKPKQQEMIKLVEVKFVYPPETQQLTQDWILMTLAKKWRAYKSRLKKKYYNRNIRSLDEIWKDVPHGVNEHQWLSLVGIWCQDSHMKICLKNSECAKQQKNSHTTGRKGHARLLKEMETERNGKVSKIELWDRAHRRKDDNNDFDNVNAIMVDLNERANDSNIQHETNNDIHKSRRNMHTSSTTFQEAIPAKCTRIKEGYANASLPHEDIVTKEAHREVYVKEHQGHVPCEQVTKQRPRLDSYSKESYANSSLGRRRIIAMKANNENSTEADQGFDVSSLQHKQHANKDKFEVYLFSANPRNKNKVVAIGSLMSQDKTYVVGGNMLGDEYCGVLINYPTQTADEKLPRPYKDIQTVRDALGHVIAWPKFYVKKKISSSNKTNNNPVNSGAKYH